MPLILTLEQVKGSSDAPISGGRETRTLDEGRLTIGRGPGNDWVLADPQHHLSKTHCVIAFVGGSYVLTDLSTNGVFVNGAADRSRRIAGSCWRTATRSGSGATGSRWRKPCHR